MNKVDQLAKIIWDYHHLNMPVKKADCILVLGSHDLRVAEYAAELFKKGYAPYIIFSGGIAHQNDLLKTDWKKPEAEIFAEVATKRGVPKDKILIENKSTNTSENIKFVKALLLKKHLNFDFFIVVQKPYMERRAFATFQKNWSEKKCLATSPPVTFEEYCQNFPKDLVINIMVGDLQRVKLYGERGWQIPQKIPPKVWRAYKELIKLGYNKHLI